MKKEDFVMLVRQHSPGAVRTLAEIAREADDALAKKQANSELVTRRLLSTHHPTHDDLRRIENMTDDEIMEALSRAFH